MSFYETQPEHPLAASGGVNVPPSRAEDPFKELDELMCVVEALCPQWPRRQLFTSWGRMIL